MCQAAGNSTFAEPHLAKHKLSRALSGNICPYYQGAFNCWACCQHFTSSSYENDCVNQASMRAEAFTPGCWYHHLVWMLAGKCCFSFLAAFRMAALQPTLQTSALPIPTQMHWGPLSVCCARGQALVPHTKRIPQHGYVFIEYVFLVLKGCVSLVLTIITGNWSKFVRFTIS